MLPKKILIIEDERDIASALRYNLEREGFRTITSGDGLEGLKLVKIEAPDLVILDLMLPGIDGIEVCRRLKADVLTESIPVLMLTAKSEESDIVLGLGMGADDYVTKPFYIKELIARVKAVLRRGPIQETHGPRELITIDELIIDTVKHQISINNEVVYFTATEFRLLHFLASHPARVFSRDQLLSRVISEDANVIDRNIDVHIRAIRKKLGKSRSIIETVRGVGYRIREMDKEDQ